MVLSAAAGWRREKTEANRGVASAVHCRCCCFSKLLLSLGAADLTPVEPFGIVCCCSCCLVSRAFVFCWQLHHSPLPAGTKRKKRRRRGLEGRRGNM
uniref:Uncharacterized protein n=1 Tax=Solanum lycopersicum TaxID=4081 RepID=A0A3Q7ITU9_SOLLC